MVLIHYKKSDTVQFLFETPSSTEITNLINDLQTINNMRLILDRLACSIEELAINGPLKPEALRGLSDPELMINAAETLPENHKKYAYPIKLQAGQRFNEDKNHFRTGVILSE